MKKNYLLIFLFLLILNLIPHIYVALNPSDTLLNWYITDDAFYYFKVAQNISEGRGITFDALAPTNGFHPLWMLVCVPVFALARLDLFLPLRVLIVIQAVLNAASGYFLFRIFADHFSEKAGWMVAIFWMFLPAIHGITTKLGVESGLNAFTLIYFIYRIANLELNDHKHKLKSADLFGVSLAAILVLFSRLDNIFILIMVGFWLVFHKSNMRWVSQVDFLLIFSAAILSYYSRIQSTDNIFNFLPFAYMLIGFSLVIKPLCLFFFGLYEFNGKFTLKQYILKTIAALSLASLLIALIFFVLHDILHVFRGISRAVLILDWFVSTGMICVYRIILYKHLHNEQGSIENDLKSNWKQWLTHAIIYFVPILCVLALYMLANKLYAGSAMPVSGQIKRWWGTLPNTVYGRPVKTLSGIVSGIFNTSMENGPFWLLTRPLFQVSGWLGRILEVTSNNEASSFLIGIVWIIALAVTLAIFSRRKRDFSQLSNRVGLLPLFTGCIIHVVSYKATGYLHAKYWYWLGEMILILIFAGILLVSLIKEIENQNKYRWLAKSVVVITTIGFVWNFNIAIFREFPLNGNASNLYDYDTDFDFLEEHTHAGDVIGMTGGGVTSYFMPDRTFVNLDGLINSAAYFESLKNGNANEYLTSIGLKYVYGEEAVLLDSDPYRWVFTGHLKLIDSSSMFNLYQYCSEDCQ